MANQAFTTATGSPQQRLDEFFRFVEYWLGPRQNGYGLDATTLSAIPMPEPLRRYYMFLGNWPDSPMSKQNVLRSPEHFATLDGAAAGLVEFAVENQGVCRWATLPGDDDPPVYRTEWSGQPPPDAGGDDGFPGWEVQDESLTNFLIEYSLRELALGGSWVTWSAPLERYAASDEADVRELLTNVTGDPAAVLVDGELLLVDRLNHRWQFCASRPGAATSVTERFNGQLDWLALNLGQSVDVGDKIRRDWSLRVWADGSARVRHHPLDEWLPPASVDTEKLVAQFVEHEADALAVTVSRVGLEHEVARLPVAAVTEIFNQLIETVPARRNHIARKTTYQARVFAAAHPPEIFGIEPRKIEAPAQVAARPNPPATPTGPAKIVGSGTATIELKDFQISFRLDGSGTIMFGSVEGHFPKSTVDFHEVVTVLQRASIEIDQPTMDVDKIKAQLLRFFEFTDDPQLQERAGFIEEFGQDAVRRVLRTPVRINEGEGDSATKLAVEAGVVETLYNRALAGVKDPSVRFSAAAANAAPPFKEAEKATVGFSIKHPDEHRANESRF